MGGLGNRKEERIHAQDGQEETSRPGRVKGTPRAAKRGSRLGEEASVSIGFRYGELEEPETPGETSPSSRSLKA